MGNIAMQTMLVFGVAFQATAGVVIVSALTLMTLSGLGFVSPC